MYAQGSPPLKEQVALHELQQRAESGLLTIARPGEVCLVSLNATQSDGTEAVTTWVELLDRAEAAMHADDLDDPFVQRAASRFLDSVVLFEHQMTPTARRLAREYVWLRDRDAPLPSAAERQSWEHCGCNGCLYERLLQRPSVQAVLRSWLTSPLPLPPERRRRVATQPALPLPA